jgi:hypothetical protein
MDRGEDLQFREGINVALPWDLGRRKADHEGLQALGIRFREESEVGPVGRQIE